MATMRIRGFATADAKLYCTASGAELARVTIAEDQGRGKEPLYVEINVSGRCCHEAAGAKKGDFITAQGEFPVPEAKPGRSGKIFLNLKLNVFGEEHFCHRRRKAVTVTAPQA